jgi:hypothetical protein
MGKATDEGIPLEDYIKLHEQPEPLVRTKLDRGELRYTWVDADGNARASDDGGPQPSQGWWTATATTIDSERRSVKGSALARPAFSEMFFVKVYPPVTVTDAPANVVPLSVNDWLFAEVGRRKEAGDIPTGRGAPTAFSEQLAAKMVEDARAGKCSRAISAKSIRARLYDQKLWPPK